MRDDFWETLRAVEKAGREAERPGSEEARPSKDASAELSHLQGTGRLYPRVLVDNGTIDRSQVLGHAGRCFEAALQAGYDWSEARHLAVRELRHALTFAVDVELDAALCHLNDLASSC